MAVLILRALPASAQVTPTPTAPPPDDTPSVRVGGLLFADFTQTIAPTITDGAAATVSPSAFNVTRAYINVAGQLNHLFAFRITPDIVRETGGGSSIAGSETLRLKYGYVQMNLDDWLWRGTFVRAGMIQTPYIDFEETVYRYRFQGTVFAEREGFMSSADFGAAIRTLTPGGYGEIMAGVYNGEGYTRADPNNQKAIEIRGTLRPFPSGNLPRGLRVTAFYTRRSHGAGRASGAGRSGSSPSSTASSTSPGAVLDAVDQASPAAPRVPARGTSFWMTPRLPLGPPPVAPAGRHGARVARRAVPLRSDSSPIATSQASSSAGSPAWRTGPRCAAPATARHSCSTSSASATPISCRRGRTSGGWPCTCWSGSDSRRTVMAASAARQDNHRGARGRRDRRGLTRRNPGARRSRAPARRSRIRSTRAGSTSTRKRHPEVEFAYQSIGSGGGIRQLTDEFVFFGASDAPMLEEELLAAPARIIHIPTVVGAVVPVYNVPGVARELKFTGALLAEMFLGRITNWNDPAIARLNEGSRCRRSKITPVFRADSSGTTYVWSDFLSKVSPEWRRQVGANRVSTVPHGLSVKGGSEGVSGAVTQTRGAIGYVELTYAVRNGLAAGVVQNSDGEFVRASVASMSAAADAAVGRMPRDLRASITNAPGKGAYPASSFTWLLLYETRGPAPQPVDGGLPHVGAQRRPGDGAGSRLRAAPARHCVARQSSAREDQNLTSARSRIGTIPTGARASAESMPRECRESAPRPTRTASAIR